MMTRIGLLSLTLLSAACAADFPPQAQDAPQGAEAAPSVAAAADDNPQLDTLFQRLRSTGDPDEAQSIEREILHVWTHSGRPEVDALMVSGGEMAHMGDLDGALAAFDGAIALMPGFAEAYEQRAAVHVMREEYGAAVLDIQRVLTLEPRHFGALAGLGRIYLLFDRDQAALRCFEAALIIDPHLDAVRHQADELREQLAGTPI